MSDANNKNTVDMHIVMPSSAEAEKKAAEKKAADAAVVPGEAEPVAAMEDVWNVQFRPSMLGNLVINGCKYTNHSHTHALYTAFANKCTSPSNRESVNENDRTVTVYSVRVCVYECAPMVITSEGGKSVSESAST